MNSEGTKTDDATGILNPKSLEVRLAEAVVKSYWSKDDGPGKCCHCEWDEGHGLGCIVPVAERLVKQWEDWE